MGSVYADLGAHSQVMTTSSNLRSFLRSVTPIVGTHTIAEWSSSSKNTSNTVRCYNLVDLWNQFYEWSACGVGTPVRLPSGKKIDQYFVPYLSALQLYTKADHISQSPSCHGDWNIPCGDISDDYNYNKSDGKANNNDQTTSATPKSRQLCFQYFELASHDDRMPLADKVYELSHDFPVLASLNSTELLPSSWMSVFWFPICHVPENNLDDLTTCFLTYHGLATPDDLVPLDTRDASHGRAALTPFGMSTHNMESVWTSAGPGDEELAASLLRAAQSWLEKNDIKHHDFDDFPNIMNQTVDEDCPNKAFDG